MCLPCPKANVVACEQGKHKVCPYEPRRRDLAALVRVALVHDYLTQHGGAERVLDALHELYPDAPIFTAVADGAALPAAYRDWDVRQTSLGRLPGAARWHRAALPIYPALFRSFGRALREFDVVLSDSSARAHHAPAPENAVHACYCHSPGRFLYRDPAYLGPARIPAALRPAATMTFAALRPRDRAAARRVDRYVANSRAADARIQAAYGRAATVIYPPVDLDRFAPAGPDCQDQEPQPWYLVVSRLVPHKQVDLAVDACTRAGLPLKVIGEGRAAPDLRARAGPTVEVLGRLDDAAVAGHVRRCRALLLPGTEDLGLTAIEAQAAGRPVVAFAAGGALETVLPGETGLFFTEPTPAALLAARAALERRAWDPRPAPAQTPPASAAPASRPKWRRWWRKRGGARRQALGVRR